MSDRPTPEQIADECEIDGGRWLLQYLQDDLGYRIVNPDDQRARDKAIIRAVERWCGIDITDEEASDILGTVTP